MIKELLDQIPSYATVIDYNDNDIPTVNVLLQVNKPNAERTKIL